MSDRLARWWPVVAAVLITGFFSTGIYYYVTRLDQKRCSKYEPYQTTCIGQMPTSPEAGFFMTYTYPCTEERCVAHVCEHRETRKSKWYEIPCREAE